MRQGVDVEVACYQIWQICQLLRFQTDHNVMGSTELQPSFTWESVYSIWMCWEMNCASLQALFRRQQTGLTDLLSARNTTWLQIWAVMLTGLAASGEFSSKVDAGDPMGTKCEAVSVEVVKIYYVASISGGCNLRCIGVDIWWYCSYGLSSLAWGISGWHLAGSLCSFLVLWLKRLCSGVECFIIVLAHFVKIHDFLGHLVVFLLRILLSACIGGWTCPF